MGSDGSKTDCTARNDSADVVVVDDDGAPSLQAQLWLVTKPNNPTDENNKVKITTLSQLKDAIALLEGKKTRRNNASHIMRSISSGVGEEITYTNSEEATIGHHQQQQKDARQTDTSAVTDQAVVMNTYSIDAIIESGPNFSERTNTTKQAFLDEVKRFELFRSVIQHEDDLLNQRVSWIILAQSFLMAAFITNVNEDGTGDALKYITAIVGLLTVVVTMPAILAAGRNIELQQHVYFSRISSEQRCRELHGHSRHIITGAGREEDARFDMLTEQRERMKHGHIFPNMAFRGTGAVPILFTVLGLAAVQVGGWCFLLAALVKGW